MNFAHHTVLILTTACLTYGYQAVPVPPLPPMPAQNRAAQNGTPQTVPPAAPPGPATSSIEGQVFNLATGAPLKKTTVRINQLGPLPQGTQPARLSKETDDQGHFSFTALSAGRYQVTAERVGFLRQNYGGHKYQTGGSPLALGVDQHARNIVFRLSPQAVIVGKVLDEDGDPVANVQVRAMRFVYRADKKQWQQTGNAQTSDIGEYRLANLDPGKYIVSTQVNRNSGPRQQGSKEPLPNEADMTYGATYYPSTLDAQSAVTVDVPGSGEVRGIDIHLKKTGFFRIRGKVAGFNGNGRQTAVVMAMPSEGFAGSPATSPAMPPDYAFELRGLTPGSYMLRVQQGNGDQQQVAFQQVQVGNQHIDGIVLAISSGAAVQGGVKIVDSNTPLPTTNLTAYLRPTVPIGASFRAKVADDMSFTIKNVVPLKYVIGVSGVPETCYVKSIMFGGQPVPDEGIDIQGGGPIEVTLSATAGSIDGAVVDKDGKPVGGALVALYPNATGRDNGNNIRQTNETGTVSFKGLKPGSYRLIAWEDIPWDAAQDPDFVKPFEGRGESVKLDASGHQAVTVKVIPASETDK